MDKPTYKCEHCGKEFKEAKYRNRHQKTHAKSHICPVCGKGLGDPQALKKHLKSQHVVNFQHLSPPPSPVASTSTLDQNLSDADDTDDATPSTSTSTPGNGKRKSTAQTGPKKKKKKKYKQPVQYDCTVCGATFESMVLLNDHFMTHVDDMIINDMEPLMEQALNNALKVVTFFSHGVQKTDLLKFFADKEQGILHYLMDSDGLGNVGVRWFMCVGIKYHKIEKGEEVTSVIFHNSKADKKLRGEDEESIIQKINKGYQQIGDKKENHINNGSKWKFKEVQHLKLCMGKYRPFVGSAFMELPKDIRFTRAILNIQNQDDKCFLWSILAYLYPTEHHSYRVQKYLPYQQALNMQNIPYPVLIVDIPKFEKQNNISVNVIGYEEGYYPLYISSNQKQKHVNLLLFEKDGKSHYCLIKDFNKMLHSQTKHNGRKYFCTYCLHGFSREDLLLEHKPFCNTHGLQHTVLPTEKDKYMQFKNIAKMLEVPFVIYADFECLLKPTTTEGRKHQHQPCGYSYLIVSTLPDYQFEAVTYSGPNVMEHFFEQILADGDYLTGFLKNKKPIIFTPEDEIKYRMSATCHICKGPVSKNEKVQDHCHLTGKFRGPAHNQCNLAYSLAYFIPVFFHNLEGYDSHLLMQELGKYKDRKLSCISKNMEKYISFSLSSLRFLDSLSFMNESLGSLVKNLAAEGDEHFHHIKRHFPDPKHRELLLRKGVYPYEWMDDESKMDWPCLPDREAFYSTLTLQGISKDDYSHAKRVWNKFDMKTMRDYHDLYLKSDVLLLADCFENFRKKCLNYYGLDPAHYYTAPGLSWDAALKMTAVKLELLTDIDMHLMVEKGVRGGVSTITHRYSKANNPKMADYNKDLPHNYILDLDANNLYGWAMSQPLPTHGFKWVKPEDIQDLGETVMDVPADDDEGYILEVDLDIPPDKHDYFNHYVPAPEHMEVKPEMLSPFSKMCQEKLGILHTPCTKLIPNLYNKKKYVIHYRTLQCYLNLGLKLTHIHRAIKFKQSPWLQQYIDFNTQKRMKAKNAFEKNFFKLMNNSVFGKVSYLRIHPRNIM